MSTNQSEAGAAAQPDHRDDEGRGDPTPFDPASIHLGSGSHPHRDQGMCLLEAVAFVAGERHTDHPVCACPVLAAYGRALNDSLDDADRQLLAPMVPRLVGTRSTPDVEWRRAYELVNSSLRFHWPLVLEAIALACDAAGDKLDGEPLGPKFRAHAEKMRALAPLDVDALIAYSKGPITYVACQAKDVEAGTPFAPWAADEWSRGEATRRAAGLNQSGGWGNGLYWTFDLGGDGEVWGVAAKGSADRKSVV